MHHWFLGLSELFWISKERYTRWLWNIVYLKPLALPYLILLRHAYHRWISSWLLAAILLAAPRGYRKRFYEAAHPQILTSWFHLRPHHISGKHRHFFLHAYEVEKIYTNMNTFYLVRHAHSAWSPDENRPLSDQGLADANRVADILQQFPISMIFSSPYQRARQTITPLAALLDIDVKIEPDLRERFLSDSEVEDFFTAVEATWEDWSYNHPGGESNLVAQERGLTVISGLQEKYNSEHIVLSTHGNLLTLILQHFDPTINYWFWKSLTMPDIYRLSMPQSYIELGETQPGKPVLKRLWQETK